MDNPYDDVSCGACGIRGHQLWRPYGCFYREDDNRCQRCAEREQKKTREGDSIGWYVPLVLADDGSIWGYTSCPPEDVQRWRDMPANETPAIEIVDYMDRIEPAAPTEPVDQTFFQRLRNVAREDSD